MYPDYNVERWHIFLIYLVWSLAAMAINIWGIRLLPTINRVALFWSLTGGTSDPPLSLESTLIEFLAATIAITCLATASGRYESAGFVFGTYINDTGFNDGAAWVSEVC